MGDLSYLKGTKITVLVDEAVPDIIVVSFAHETRIFRGVLLDTSKRTLPCGIMQLNPAFTAVKPDDDLLYAVNQRYAYADPTSSSSTSQISVPSTTTVTSRLKSNKIGKMTVRLRPRQVLCSKCKDICNENSESITRKRKAPDVPAPTIPIAMVTSPETTSPTSPAKRSANAPLTRSALAIQQNDQTKHDETTALSGNVNKLNIDNNKKVPLGTVANQANENSLNAIPPRPCDTEKKLKRVIITRKKSLGLANDPNVSTEEMPPTSTPLTPSGSNTRTIKICYGPQGEGTVLKIPAQIQSLNVGDDEDIPEENVVEEPNIASKATRKAMKKAKKAKKKVTLQTTIGSPEQYPSSYSIGSSSPRYTVGSASPRHGLGNHSPRFVGNLPPVPATNFEPSPKKRKHKMKHKKKHKEDRDRKHKDDEKAETITGNKCVTQKLSINLKRLSGTYTTTSSLADSTSANSEHEDKEEDSGTEEVPDFPPSPLRMKLTVKSLNSALSAEGVQILVGDIVWGKIQGFPWWPGKILTISHGDNESLPQAHVSWYGSSTSSLIQCDQLSPYLSSFKARYDKKKRGPYKDAIKQASNEARILDELKNTTAEATASAATSSSTSPSRVIMMVSPALASPREINVIS